jgi:glycosyl transferase family 87
MEVRRQLLIRAFAVAGALVCAGQIVEWSLMGAWPFHDTAAYWVAGVHLREGAAVYGQPLGSFLSMIYAPPWAVLYAPLSFLPLEFVTAIQFIAQLLALRYVVGSWRNAGLVAWLPIVPRELVTGNVDLLMAAAIYAAVRDVRHSGAPIALFMLAKFSPVLALARSRREWRTFALATALLVAITLPWPFLWPQWAANLAASNGAPVDALPLLPRIPVVIALLAARRSWSIAAAAALATPAFYFHSWVLLLPALRLVLATPRAKQMLGDFIAALPGPVARRLEFPNAPAYREASPTGF